jgi:hypothetical protein
MRLNSGYYNTRIGRTDAASAYNGISFSPDGSLEFDTGGTTYIFGGTWNFQNDAQFFGGNPVYFGSGITFDGGTTVFRGLQAGTATLVAGTVTISDIYTVMDTSKIMVTVQSLGTVTVPQAVGVTARSPGAPDYSFTITSADPTDTSVVAWTLIN